MRAIVVVPTYNELANLQTLVDRLRQFAPDLHVLIVDDNSPDGTGALADELSSKNPQSIFVLHRERKEGLGKAYVDGFREVLKKDYEYVLQMDADLSHDPSHLPEMFARIVDHDLVVGSRYLNGISVVNWDLKRLVMSKLATGYVRFITRIPFTDATSGFNCWRRKALEAFFANNRVPGTGDPLNGIVIAGNDGQFRKLCQVLDLPGLPSTRPQATRAPVHLSTLQVPGAS